MRIHPVCDQFPTMSSDERDRLEASIRAYGVLDPVLTWNGWLMDGRHRRMMADKIGCPCPEQEFEGTEEQAINVAILRNRDRRHLNSSQLACLGVDLLPIIAEARKRDEQRAGAQFGRSASAKEAAATVGVSPSLVEKAATLKARDPAAFQAVKDGDKSVGKALEQVAEQTEVKLDPAGVPIPARLAPAFADGKQLLAFRRALAGSVKYLREMTADPMRGAFVTAGMAIQFENVIKAIDHAACYAVCPYCLAEKPACKGCRGQGWVSRVTWDAAPPEIKGPVPTLNQE